MPRPYRVFLSHTSELSRFPVGNSFVASAVDAVIRAGNVPVEMDYFTAQNTGSAEYSQTRVRECDIYVGIIGFRYGTPVREQPDVSYTELEFMTASEAGLPRLIFPVSDDAEGLPPSALCDVEYGDRQESFRRRLMTSDVVVRSVRTAAELNSRLYQSLMEMHAQADLGQIPRPERAALFMVPEPTGFLVARPELSEQLISLLSQSSEDPVGVITAVGAGGFGKTTLAEQVCRMSRVRAMFPDGILWVTVGQNVTNLSLAAKVNDLSTQLSGDRPDLSDPMQAGFNLGRILGNRRMLLVVDDVWQPGQLAPFLQGGSNTRRLVTSRNRKALPELAHAVVVDAMTPDEADQLLTAGLEGVQPEQLARLRARAGSWPLLLSLINSQIRTLRGRGASAQEATSEVDEELQSAGPTALDVTDPVERRLAVESTFGASLALLDDPRHDRVERYLELAVFPEDAYIPRSVLECYWAATAGWTRLQVRRFCDELATLSLVQSYQASPPRLRLHDVAHNYLRHRAGATLASMHAALLDAYRPRLRGDRSAWWTLPDTEQYMWSSVCYHLRHAGLGQELHRLVTDRRYLVARIRQSDTVGLEADLALADGELPGELRRLIAQESQLLRPTDPEAMLRTTLDARIAAVPALRDAVVDPRGAASGHELSLRWPLPDQSDPALHRVLRGGGAPITAAVFSPDGKSVASAGGDGTVRLWDTATGRHLHILTGHTTWITSIAFSPDGQTLASASQDGTVRLWDAVTGACRHVLNGHIVSVEAVAFDPSGERIASVGGDCAIRLWDVATGDQLRTFVGHTMATRTVAFTPDGRTLGSAGDDGTVRLWNVAEGTQRFVLAGHVISVQVLAFSLDGKLLATGGRDGSVRLWDVASGSPLPTVPGHAQWVRATAFSPDGTLLASASWDGTVRLWNPEDGATLHVLTGHLLSAEAVAFAPDRELLVSAAGDGTLHLWEPRGGRHLRDLIGHTKSVWSVTFSPDGTLLASASWDGTVRLWRTSGWQSRVRYGTVFGGADAIAASADGSMLAVATSDGVVRLLDPGSGAEICQLSMRARHMEALAFGAGDALLAAGGADGIVDIWDVAKRTIIHSLRANQARCRALVFGADDQLISAGDDGRIWIWDIRAGVRVTSWWGAAEQIAALAVRPDDRLLATGGSDGSVRLWDLPSGRRRRTLPGFSRAIGALAFSSDGESLASGGDNGALRIWNLRAPGSLVLTGHEFTVEDVTFSPDGRLLTSVGRDGTIRIWLVRTGEFLTGMRVEGRLAGVTWRSAAGELTAVGARGVYAFSYGPGSAPGLG